MKIISAVCIAGMVVLSNCGGQEALVVVAGSSSDSVAGESENGGSTSNGIASSDDTANSSELGPIEQSSEMQSSVGESSAEIAMSSTEISSAAIQLTQVIQQYTADESPSYSIEYTYTELLLINTEKTFIGDSLVATGTYDYQEDRTLSHWEFTDGREAYCFTNLLNGEYQIYKGFLGCESDDVEVYNEWTYTDGYLTRLDINLGTDTTGYYLYGYADGLLESWGYYTDEDVLSSYEEYEYDSDGGLVKSSYYYGTGELVSYALFSY
ncbi:MAG: hypothetical protein OCD76_09325 [Reichenbachiella sp.]